MNRISETMSIYRIARLDIPEQLRRCTAVCTFAFLDQ